MAGYAVIGIKIKAVLFIAVGVFTNTAVIINVQALAME